MSDDSALERRYRRLLTWFPAAHRGVYGEEMIGVLLASTPEGRDRPSRQDALNLVGGGLRARFGRLRTAGGNQQWGDALAVFSVIAPILLFVQLTVAYLSLVRMSFPPPPSGLDSAAATMLAGSALAIVSVAVGPALKRRSRSGVAKALALITAAVAITGAVQAYLAFPFYWLPPYYSLFLVIEVAAVLISPGPSRGWQLLTRTSFIILAIIAIGVPVLCLTRAVDYAWVIFAAGPIAGQIGVALTLRGRTGRRLLALCAIPGCLLVGNDVLVRFVFLSVRLGGTSTIIAALYLPSLAVALMVVAAARWSARRERPRAPGAQ
jgi:hypothetical protein